MSGSTTPGDRLTVRDLKILQTLVETWVRTRPAGSKERERAEGLLRRLLEEDKARPPSLGPTVGRVLLDVATQGPERAAHSVQQLAEAFFRAGDVEAPVQLRRVAETIRNVREQAGAELGPQKRGLASEIEALVDKRSIDWYEPDAFTDAMILPAALRPVLELLLEDLRKIPTFLDLEIDAPTRVLFHGPPGVGKSLGARWIGSQLGVPLALVRLDGVESPIIGQTIKNLRDVFDKVNRRPGTIVFLDEIDGIAMRRDEGTGSLALAGQQVTSALLQQLDALPRDQIVIAATNFLDKIDPALSRRMATKVEFPYPDGEARGAMLDAWWRRLRVDQDARTLLVTETDRRSGDFLRAVAMSAARRAVTSGGARPTITVSHVQEALAHAVPPGDLRPRNGAGGNDRTLN